MSKLDLKWAQKQFQGRRALGYKNLRKYDDGDHDLAFATESFRSSFGLLFREFAENMCPAVVDSLNDRLELIGFQSSEAKTVTEDIPSDVPGIPARKKVTIDDPDGVAAKEIWDRNNLDAVATSVHRDSILMGDSYVIVWPTDGRAEIFPQLPEQCATQMDANRKGVVSRGAKTWFDDDMDRWRMNVYLPTMIEKWIATGKGPNTYPSSAEGWRAHEAVGNPWGIVPLFPFHNKNIHGYGLSELKDVIPLQDALNKSVMDMLIAMEFASFKQRYIIGMDVEIDEVTGEPKDQTTRNYGVDRLMAIPDTEAKVGQFDATDLTQFLKVQDKFWMSVSRVSGMPLHYVFITTGDFPSGEAMKAAEARFTKKIRDQQTLKGEDWERVLLFAMLVEDTLPEDLRLDAQWVAAAPRSESELADTAVKKKAIGVSRSQLLAEMGYDDEQIIRMLEESDADAASKAQAELNKSVTGGRPSDAGREAIGATKSGSGGKS